MSTPNQQNWWESLKHFGLLLSPGLVARLETEVPFSPLPFYRRDQLRRELNRFEKKIDFLLKIVYNPMS